VRLVLLVVILATMACDRVTKQIAADTLASAPTRSYVADTFRLDYAENTGAFLGIGSNWPPVVRTALFSIGNGVLLLVLTVLTMRLHWQRAASLGLAFFVAGGLSNLIDRLAYGKVIDFMNVGIGPVRTGIFNVADVAITIGALLVIWSTTARDSSGLPS
jgi:signal peptidase II